LKKTFRLEEGKKKSHQKTSLRARGNLERPFRGDCESILFRPGSNSLVSKPIKILLREGKDFNQTGGGADDVERTAKNPFQKSRRRERSMAQKRSALNRARERETWKKGKRGWQARCLEKQRQLSWQGGGREKSRGSISRKGGKREYHRNTVKWEASEIVNEVDEAG